MGQRRIAIFACSAALGALLGSASLAQNSTGTAGQAQLPPGRGMGLIYSDVAKQNDIRLYKALTDEYDRCDRAAFNHDLQNLAALADILQNKENTERMAAINDLRVSGKYKTDAALNKALDKQRDSADTLFGQYYNDSIAINHQLAYFRGLSWAKCAEKSATTYTAPSKLETMTYTTPLKSETKIAPGAPTEKTAGANLKIDPKSSGAKPLTLEPKTYGGSGEPLKYAPPADTKTGLELKGAGAKPPTLNVPAKTAPSAPPLTCPKGQKVIIIEGKARCSGAAAAAAALGG
ncbi:MAG: hypothetical protein AB1429_17080 [Pseudomonadota bacterium]|jgi:hypothetical protein